MAKSYAAGIPMFATPFASGCDAVVAPGVARSYQAVRAAVKGRPRCLKELAVVTITPLMPVYPRCGVRPVRGEGAYLFG
ncbi:MAG: hypothetical protein EON55_22535, partial [Alphaproteobacteria bacterium]